MMSSWLSIQSSSASLPRKYVLTGSRIPPSPFHGPGFGSIPSARRFLFQPESSKRYCCASDELKRDSRHINYKQQEEEAKTKQNERREKGKRET